MIRDIRYYENRIALMECRTGRENDKIIKKCKRKIRNLQEKERKQS